MTTVRDAVETRTDPLTRRIYTALALRGMSTKLVAELAGIEPTTWRRRARNGDWRTKETQRIARVVGVPFAELIGLNEAA